MLPTATRSMAVDWANWLMYVNRLEDALGYLGDLLQRDSYPPTYIWEVRGQTQYFLRRHEEAIASLRRMHGKHFWTPMFRAAAFAQLGQATEARRELGDFLEARPKASLDSVAKKLGYADKALGDHLLDGLRKAGLPE